MHFEAYCKYNNIEYHNLEFYDMENFYGIKDKYSFNKIPKIFLPSLNTRYGIIENISKFASKLNIKSSLKSFPPFFYRYPPSYFINIIKIHFNSNSYKKYHYL